jgi:hypothetical protein
MSLLQTTGGNDEPNIYLLLIHKERKLSFDMGRHDTLFNSHSTHWFYHIQ